MTMYHSIDWHVPGRPLHVQCEAGVTPKPGPEPYKFPGGVGRGCARESGETQQAANAQPMSSAGVSLRWEPGTAHTVAVGTRKVVA
jgi:hypothetical protein